MVLQGLNQRKVRSSIIAYLFILPALIIFTTIILIPTLETFRLSMTKWDGVNPVKVFVGFNNYCKLFLDRDLYSAFINNFIWIIFYVFTPTLTGLLLALSITKKGIKGRDAFRVIYFIPYILSPVVVALIWQWMYSANIGVLSLLLQAFHIVDKAYGILGDMKFALYGLIVVHIWTTIGFCAIIYIVGLQNINQDLYGAAMLDGANALQIFWYIILPSLSSVTTFLILLNVINSFKVFNLVFLMTNGGPCKSTEVAAFYLYKQAFVFNRAGYSCAIAILLTLVLVVFGIVFIMQREKKISSE